MHNVLEATIDDDHAYVAAGESGLLVVYISDPRDPREVASLDTPGHAYHVATRDDFAYVADGWEGVQVIGIADPETSAGFGLQVFDVASPSHPARIAFWDEPPTAAVGVTSAAGIACLADREWGVRAIDVAGDGAPRFIAGYPTAGAAFEGLHGSRERRDLRHVGTGAVAVSVARTGSGAIAGSHRSAAATALWTGRPERRPTELRDVIVVPLVMFFTRSSRSIACAERVRSALRTASSRARSVLPATTPAAIMPIAGDHQHAAGRGVASGLTSSN